MWTVSSQGRLGSDAGLTAEDQDDRSGDRSFSRIQVFGRRFAEYEGSLSFPGEKQAPPGIMRVQNATLWLKLASVTVVAVPFDTTCVILDRYQVSGGQPTRRCVQGHDATDQPPFLAALVVGVRNPEKENP